MGTGARIADRGFPTGLSKVNMTAAKKPRVGCILQLLLLVLLLLVISSLTGWNIRGTISVSLVFLLPLTYYLNPNHFGTRSFASNSGSSSNLGHNRSTSVTGSRLIRVINSWHASINCVTLPWQKPRVTS